MLAARGSSSGEDAHGRRGMGEAVLGIIGGSGLYEIDGLENTRWERVESPWGEASDELFFGELGGSKLAFLPRHGRGHRLSPGDINYRANIDALKRAGVRDILSLSACGSFREELAPGSFVIVDQFIDRTRSRKSSFFGSGVVAHVSMAHPVCARLGDALEAVCQQGEIQHRRGGTYLAMEGPQFSSLAESKLYRSWGCDVIGMTNLPEAKLAREAEICYATVAMVTDYDCWHPNHDNVEVDALVAVLTGNADRARSVVRDAAPALAARPEVCPHGCDRVLDTAIITAPEARDRDRSARLDAVAGRVLRS
jgi:5'-methylthioadenosine phosphorylase